MTEGDSPEAPSFLAVHEQVPASLREVLAEAEGCQQHRFFTGGAACARRALDMLLTMARAEGDGYQKRVQSLHEKHGVQQTVTALLAQCAEVTSRDGAKVPPNILELFLATLKAAVYELYVIGPERVERLQYLRRLAESAGGKGSAASAARQTSSPEESAESFQASVA
jgi:hypothetical protein